MSWALTARFPSGLKWHDELIPNSFLSPLIHFIISLISFLALRYDLG